MIQQKEQRNFKKMKPAHYIIPLLIVLFLSLSPVSAQQPNQPDQIPTEAYEEQQSFFGEIFDFLFGWMLTDETIPAGDTTASTGTAGDTTVNTGTAGDTTTGNSSPDSSMYGNGEVSPGYTLFAPLSGTSAYLIDMDGDVVHEWNLNGNPGNAVYLLENGNLLATYKVKSNRFDAGGVGGGIEILDWDGNQIWSYELANDDVHLHHDVEYLPGGNILMISWEKFGENEALDAGVDGEYIIDGAVWSEAVFEINPDTNDIVWEWHAWDHLLTKNQDAGVHPELIDPDYPPIRQSSDWLHINSVDYNEALDQVMLSIHNTNELWIIDHGTTTSEAAGHVGDLVYRFGNNEAFGARGEQLFYGQHNVNWIHPESASSNILLFNNGNMRTRAYSTVLEIDADSSDSYGKGDVVWEYGEASKDEKFFSNSISGAQRLENGNTLICSGTEGWFFEVTPDGEKVWEFFDDDYAGTTPKGEVSKAVFRAERYSLDLGRDGRNID